MRKISCAVMLCGLLLPRPGGAACPFQTDDAGAVATGTFEAEWGSEFQSDAGAFGIGLKHGLTERMDLGIALGYAAWPEADRSFDNAELNAKFALIPELLSASFTTVLGTTAYNLNGIVSRSWDDFGLNLDLGGDFVGGDRDADLSWGANPTYAVGPALVGAELRGNQHGARMWQAGGQVKFGEGLDLHLAIGTDFESDPRWRATAGLWFAFPSTQKKGS